MGYTQITKTRDSGAEFSVIGAHDPRTLEHKPVIGLVPAVRASDSALVSPKELDVKIFSALIDDDDPRQKKLKEIFAPNVTAKELHQARSLKFTLFEKMLMDTLNNPSSENSVAGTAASPQFTISGKNSYEISFPGFNITKQGSRETTGSNVDVVLAAFLAKDHLDSLKFTRLSVDYNFGSTAHSIGVVVMKSDQAETLFPQVVRALHRLNEMENANANLQTGNLLRKMRDANGPDTQMP